jgi:peptidoglycan-associated lipoprotein
MLFANGCVFKKNHSNSNSEGSSIALYNYPLDKFIEPKTDELKLILKDFHFDYNSSKINNNQKPLLTSIANWLKETTGTLHILIEGHCDERGNNEYNLVLGEQRALAIRHFLINAGIDDIRIQTISYGEERSINLDHNETAWKKNRRGHFLIAG